MRVYHFVSAEYGLQDVVRGRLKVATLADVNDPFEMLAPDLSDPALRKALGKARDEFADRYGLLCFSRNWRDPVQWSHYGDNHRGLCLGFDVPDRLLREVRYRKRRTSVAFGAMGEPHFAMAAFLLEGLEVKFEHWAYEDEVRMVVELEGLDRECGIWFRGFDEGLVLREVIVGACSAVTRGQIANALGNDPAGVVARKARLAFQSYRVVNQRRAELWR